MQCLHLNKITVGFGVIVIILILIKIIFIKVCLIFSIQDMILIPEWTRTCCFLVLPLSSTIIAKLEATSGKTSHASEKSENLVNIKKHVILIIFNGSNYKRNSSIHFIIISNIFFK